MTLSHTPSAGLPAQRLLLTLLLLVGFVAAGCGGDDEGTLETEAGELTYTIGEPLTDSTYAALVTSEYGTDTLTTAAFRKQLSMFYQQMPQIQGNVEQSRALRRNIVQDFIMRHVLFGEADRLGIATDTAAVSQQLAQLRNQYGGAEGFREALAAESLTEDSVRISLGEYTRQQQVIDTFATAAPALTDADLTTFREDRAQQVRAQHILFLTQGKNDDELAAIRTEAEAVLDSARQGVDFAELARRHSEDGTARQGGDLGYFSRGQMVPPFEEAVFALADSGAVTQELVETRFGYHVIRLTGRRTGDLMDENQARQMLERQRRQEAVEEQLDALRKKVTVRLHPAIVDADLNEDDAF